MANNTPEESTSIKGLFQGLIPDACGVIQGTVTSVSPLSIRVVNDEKLTLNASILIVPKHLTDYTATVDIVQGKGSVNSKTATDGGHTHKYNGNTENGGEPDHNHGYKGTTEEAKHSHSLASFNIYKATMTVYNALKVGEKVHLLSFDNGKKYYVLDRVV